MLEFTKEKISNQLVASSETTPFKTYWIEEAAWTYLTVVEGVIKGPEISLVDGFRGIEEAIAAANELEGDE